MTPVRALEDGWLEVLESVLASRGAPAIADAARMGARVAELSRAYNLNHLDVARPKVPLDARIGFSFARDVPKGAAAIRELLATGALALAPDAPLRLLDLGAGLGAMTWGVVRALEASGAHGRVEALLVDDDGEALAAATAIAREAQRLGPRAVELALETRHTNVARSGTERWPESDLVLVGQVLSELDRALEPEARAAAHAAMLGRLLEERVAPGGALVVVEPALRDRTRHLHAVRDRLVAEGAVPFAPCLHARPCPALASADDWCHEDLEVDLPPWLVPVARAAGLRWQGLTFSYLVLRKDRRAVADALVGTPPRHLHLRVISERIVTKGKVEIFACTRAGERVRMRRLDRERTEASAAWDELARGDVVTIDAETDDGTPPVDARGRLAKNVGVDVWRGKN